MNTDIDAAIIAGTHLLTTKELAQRLGLSPKHGHRTISAKVKAGRIPCVRIASNEMRFHWPSVIQKLQSIR